MQLQLIEPQKVTIKGLTFWEPWGTLACDRWKGWETRPPKISWRNYRGWIAIHTHSSRKPKRDEIDAIINAVPDGQRYFAAGLHIDRQMLADKLTSMNVLCGYIIGICQITAVVEMTEHYIKSQTDLELAVGNWAPGRLAIRLEHAQRLEKPIRTPGGQGLWTPADAVLDQLQEVLRAA